LCNYGNVNTVGGVNLGGVRRHNRGLVLDLLLRSGGSDLLDLASEVGLTQQGVSKIATDLVDAGLVERSTRSAARVGKPRTRLRLRSEAGCVIGVQLGRDGLTAVRVGLDGRIEDRREARLPTNFTPPTAVRRIGASVRALLADQPPERALGIGVGAVGPLDHRTRRVVRATGLSHWVDVPLGDLLEAEIGLEVTLDKDTDAGAVAHCWPAPPGAATAVVMVDSGIGAGLMLDGQIYRGPRSGAGEFGHITLDRRGPECACGRRGCLEELHRRAAPPAKRGELVGEGLLDLVRILDLDSVILYGSRVRDSPQAYLAAVRAVLDQATPEGSIDVRIGGQGPDAVALGAALGTLSATLREA
jgi:predicted NBD/HSP70 family sugar kinase